MDFSVSKTIGGLGLGGLLALTMGAGTMQANLLAATSPVAVTCNTATGPGAAATQRPGLILLRNKAGRVLEATSNILSKFTIQYLLPRLF